jgi:hypothetical protein
MTGGKDRRYTPYGEVWIEWANGGVVHNETLPFRFTGKELDSQFAIANILRTSARTRTEGTPEETGLYYYGARKRNQNLPGHTPR